MSGYLPFRARRSYRIKRCVSANGSSRVNSIGTVFISYAHADDAGWTTKLATDLERDGFTVFFDKWDIAPGDGLVRRLDEGLNSASSGLIVFGRSTAKSPWVYTEYSALVQRMMRGEAKLIPVLRDDVPLPPILGTQVIADFRHCVSESQYQSCLLELEQVLNDERPVRSNADSTIKFAKDMGRRPEGPRRVTLTIEREQVSIKCGEGEAVLPHDAPDHRIQERLWLVERARSRLAAARIRPGSAAAAGSGSGLHELLVRLGQAIGNQFLAGPIGDLLEAELTAADRQNAALQIALEVSDDRMLQALPWETMCLNGQAEPLILHPRAQMYRFLPGLGSTAAISIPGPLRVLAVIASPEQGSREMLDYEAELDRILRAVDRARRQERAMVRVLDWGSAAAIRTALREERYHILHISCQARPGALVLETEEGSPDPVDAERFAAEVLVPDRGVPLVILAGGTTAARPEAGSSGTVLPNLAKGLLAHGVPAVLAMISDTNDRYTIRLASHFYQALASRQQAPDPLAALSDARRELESARVALPPQDAGSALAEWWMPVLHLRTPPAPLFNPDRAGAGGPVEVPDRPLAGPGRGVDEFVGRRSDLRKLLRVLRGDLPAVVIYGIGGMGKTSLATRLINALGAGIELVLFIRGRTTPTEILQKLGQQLRPLCIKRHLAQTDALSQVAHELQDPRQDWADQISLVEQIVLPQVSVVLVLDEAEQNMRDAEQGPMSDSPSELTDPELAAFIGRWTALGQNARLLVTSRYPIALASEVISRLTFHHLGPLSRVETDKLMWRLTALDGLEPDERDRAYADVGGHPRALEYVDSLLRGHGVRFADVAARMETALRTRGIEDPSRWLPSGPRDLNQALAETVTLIVDDVLVDRLLVRLQSFPLALRLFVTASVFRTPVDATGLNWAVADSLDPVPDPAREARIARAYEQLAAAQEAGSAFTLEQLSLPAGLLAQLKRDCAVFGRPPERPGLDHAIEALLDMSLLSLVPDSRTNDPQYLVHRWTARGLRSLVQAGLAELVDPAELTEAHRRVAAYYEWRAEIWPDAVADLLEARYHYQESGERESAAAMSMRAAAILFRWGAFSLLQRLCEETRPEIEAPGVQSCELLHWLSRTAQVQGDLSSAERLCREALALAGQLDDLRWIAICDERLASIAAERSEYDAALRAYRTAIDLARELQDVVIEARCYQGFGSVALAKGDDDEAERYSRGALNLRSSERLQRQQMIIYGRQQLRELARARGDRDTAARLARDGAVSIDDLKQVAGQSQLQIGKVSLRRDDLEGAEAAFEEARGIAEQSRDLVTRKDCYLRLGQVYQRRGALSQARDSYQQYINLADDMGDRPGTVGCYHQMGELAEAHGDWAGAASWHERALKLAEELGQPRLLAEAYRRLAQIHLARGDAESAEASYRRSEEIGEQTKDPQVMVSSRLGLAQVNLQSGHLAAAEQTYRDARQIARRNRDQVGVTRCQMGLATVARRRGDYDDASHLFKEAYENAAEMRNQAVASECLLELGITAEDGGDRGAAVGYYRRALALAEVLRDGQKIADLCIRLGSVSVGFWARMEWYQRAAETYDTHGYQLTAASVWISAGQFAAGFDLDEAILCCGRALDRAGRDELFPVTIEAWLELARCCRKRGEHEDARDAFRHASELAERAERDDLMGLAFQEGGLISQLNGDTVSARALHQHALTLAERVSDRDTMIAACRDLGRLARRERDEQHGSLEYWYGRALSLAEQGGDDGAVIACAQQLLVAAFRAGEAEHAAELIAAHPVLVGRLDSGPPADSRLAARRGKIGAELTTDGRPDEALGFTAASLLAWLDIDRQQAEQQVGWLRRQRAELGDEWFTELLAEYVEAGLLAALVDISMPSATRAQDAGTASAEVDPREADAGDGTQHGQ
jgi:tetratricopeptide (TPR) repeat protein